MVGTSATVTDIATVRNTVGSSLTSVDLAGLTRIELSFALVLAVGAGGLVLALGLSNDAGPTPSPPHSARSRHTCAP